MFGRLRHLTIYTTAIAPLARPPEVVHIEGDADHPTNADRFCPKGAALKDTVHSATRLTQPRIRRPGSDKFEEITWEAALDKIARALKDDRDAEPDPAERRQRAVNRWTTTVFWRPRRRPTKPRG